MRIMFEVEDILKWVHGLHRRGGNEFDERVKAADSQGAAATTDKEEWWIQPQMLIFDAGEWTLVK